MAYEQFFAGAGLAGAFAALGAFAFAVGIALYVYYAWAWMTIAKKLNYDKPWLAWIPIANLFLIPILAKKEWLWGFIFILPIANIVFYIMWTWKIFEMRKYPGWLSLVILLSFIPMLSAIAGIANLVIIGLVAWRDV